MGNIDYLTLLTEPHSKRDLEGAIRKEATQHAEDGGFQLRGCRVDTKLIDPSPESLTDELKTRWHAYLTQRAALEEINLSVADETELIRLEREKQTLEKKRLIEQENIKNANQLEIDRQNALEERDREIGLIATRKMENGKLERERQAKLSTEIREIDEQVQRQVAIAESNLKRLKDELRWAETAKEHEEAIAALRQNNELDQLRLEQAELKRLIAQATQEEIRAIGSAEAEVEKLKRLAEHAASLESHKLILDGLPPVLRSAFSPAEKLSDIKCIYWGSPGVHHADGSANANVSSDGLGSMLSSMSTLPMVREVLRFIDDWQTGRSGSAGPSGTPSDGQAKRDR